MNIIDVIHEEEENDLFLIAEELRDMAQQTIISESLGNGLAVELDPATGAVTLLDEQHGIRLSPMQVLALTGFLSQHDAVLLPRAYAALDEV